MNEVTRLFIKTVFEEEKLEINYTNGNLKRRLKIRYPQLRFVKRAKRTKCELVLHEILDTDVAHSLDSVSCRSSDSNLSISEENNTFSGSVNEVLQTLYSSSLTLKSYIDNSPSLQCSWPPSATDLTIEAAETIVPPTLFNFLAWITGISDDPKINEYVLVNDKSKRKLLSIAQDILFLSSGCKKHTPKHLVLGMTIRHLTGPAKLTGLLSGLGHSVSQSTILQLDTDIALLQLKNQSLFPQNSISNVFTTLVWDNSDFGEETLSGGGTTHCTNGIILQWESTEEGNTILSEPFKRHRKRTLEPPSSEIVPLKNFKRSGPQNPISIDSILFSDKYGTCSQEPFKKIDSAFYLSKLNEHAKIHMPGWTGFNTYLHNKKSISLTKIGYLPILDANPTEISTVNTILDKSLKIADEFKLSTIVVVMDQALYSKAQQIRWSNKEYEERIILRLGEFHTLMSFLAIIGKRFRDAGLEDIFIESGLVAQNSLNGVMNGNHYNRSIRAHKIMAEALETLRWQSFIEQTDKTTFDIVNTKSEELYISYKNKTFVNILEQENTDNVLKMYRNYVKQCCLESPTFKFWSSYLEMVEIMLLFQRATREDIIRSIKDSKDEADESRENEKVVMGDDISNASTSEALPSLENCRYDMIKTILKMMAVRFQKEEDRVIYEKNERRLTNIDTR
ncbi:unnamed protein product [Larinioides sclopetarius]|uniref:Uncharacterized protein n=1 Tax=Larinioides sclopetarius TaxID=280406 RepID=A0AAV2BD83_9ARAC